MLGGGGAGCEQDRTHQTRAGCDRSASLAGRGFHAKSVDFPPLPVPLRQVRFDLSKTGRSVDELANDIGMPGVTIRLGEHAYRDPVQCDSRR